MAALKGGAADYVIKNVGPEFFTLLSTAIEQAVEAVRLKQAKEQADLEIRAARDQFEALAAERNLLLREVNHRVGNSLQIIASMLRFQSAAASAEEVRQALDAARQRVIAVAQVHRSLYGSANVKRSRWTNTWRRL